MLTVRRTLLAGALGVVLFGFALSLPTRAQGFRYETTTSLKLTGTTGDVVGALASLGGGLDEVLETISILEDKMRIDRGGTSTIYDLEGKRLVTLKGEECSFVTFEHLRQQVEAAKEQADAAEAGGQTTGEATYDLSEVKFDFSVQRSGGAEEISGYRTYPVTFTVIAEATGEVRKLEQVEGTVVVVSDVFLASNVAGYEVARAFQQRLAEEMGAIYLEEGGVKKLKAALERDPLMKAAMEQALEEQIKLDGVPVRTTTYFVFVPAGLTYDPFLVRPERVQTKKKIGRFVRKALRKKKEKADPSPRQQTLFFVTSTMSDLYHGPLDAALFETPAHCEEAE